MFLKTLAIKLILLCVIDNIYNYVKIREKKMPQQQRIK